MKLLTTLAATALSLSYVHAAAIRRANDGPAFPQDFADPSVTQDEDGTWYAFGTTGNGKQIQVARSEGIYGNWSLLDEVDAMPEVASWSTGTNTWAPDVHLLSDGKYVMYFAGEVANNTKFHCIGVAVSDEVTGPYVPEDEPFACNTNTGGAIDPSGFEDDGGTRYVVYKVDGNSIGHGGSCGNTVEPIVPTPIMLQEVKKNGVTKVGDPVEILDRTDDDGPYVEAPSLLRTDNGLYILFFSSGCYTESTYNVNYATSTSLTGPYKRAQTPMIKTGEFSLQAPGGATAVNVWDKVGVVFHANCPTGRCMYTTPTVVDGREVKVEM
ncbi:glycoside hydrolase family 43 protein [Hypoxylon sp. CI-4A]|nr:glycoside hydrolase family 43 protein [Hypoxylon sp. CI-4A]